MSFVKYSNGTIKDHITVETDKNGKKVVASKPVKKAEK